MSSRWNCRKYLVSLLMLEVCLIGCTPPVPAAAPAESTSPPPSPSQILARASQALPIGATVQIGSQTIQLEVAKTPEQQAIGLMNRASLAGDRGMLFLFEPAQQVGFWMKNCLINLDMVFLRAGQVQSIASNAPPCTKDPCPIYGPKVPVDQVIELRGGRAKELGLKVGDRLTVLYP